MVENTCIKILKEEVEKSMALYASNCAASHLRKGNLKQVKKIGKQYFRSLSKFDKCSTVTEVVGFVIDFIQTCK